jgi:hypothetical protein
MCFASRLARLQMLQDKNSEIRPQIQTYDSGYEHSLEHWLELQKMVAAEAETAATPVPLALAAAAGF